MNYLLVYAKNQIATVRHFRLGYLNPSDKALLAVLVV
jgi:hypothetical protein